MIALRRLLAVTAWLGGELAAVAALTALGSRPPFTVPVDGFAQWLGRADSADTVIVALRWVALVGAWWLLGSTVLYVLMSLTRVPRAVRAVRWAALPSVRRAVDAALAVSVVAGSVLGPSVARAATNVDPPVTSVTSVRDGRPGGLASLPSGAAPALPKPAAPKPAPPAPAPPAPASVQPAVATVVVAPGDNLWELSARHLATATGRARADVGDVDVAPYWVAVCERNRATLASGDPSLVFPGEIVTFPPVS